ncbi:hypothetical protein [Streptomyces sp. NPDC088725]|uniref:hypothetical protein n=1 Tax=Streptomyces sp. NPDC088725 TaxID=3365873 RepID=UPI00382B09AD
MPERTARTSGLATAAAALLVTGVVVAPSAGAADHSPADAGSTGTRHCVVDSRTGEQSCFATFPEAIEAASGGAVTDAPASSRSAAEGTSAADTGFRTEMKEFNSDARTLEAGEVIQGTFFDETQFGGSSLTITGAAPCVKDGWIEYQYDFPDEWKNRVSSVQPWANCWIWLYPEPDLGGDRDGPFDENAPDIGSFMNDRAQSVGFS